MVKVQGEGKALRVVILVRLPNHGIIRLFFDFIKLIRNDVPARLNSYDTIYDHSKEDGEVYGHLVLRKEFSHL